jgi:amidase
MTELEETSIADLRAALDDGRLSVRELVDGYLARFDALDRDGPRLNSVIEINPEAQTIADALDAELQGGTPRGPLHGIPILLKDNIDTADQMLTTAGSLALVNSRPSRDAFVVERLRAAGAVILGKTTLSEWANFRGFQSTSGWSGRGGQCRNPYILDRNPSGSSSGSAASVSASLCAAAVGTETDGSIVSPSNNCGVVGIKPTVGLTSRAGVIPIAHSQDTIGAHGRTVADAAMLLSVMVGSDPRDPMTAATPAAGTPVADASLDFTAFLDPEGLRGARIGVPRNANFWGYSRQADAIAEAAIEVMRSLGAEIIDPADLPSADEAFNEPGEFEVLLYEFKADLNAYLAERGDADMRTLEDLIRFNEEHADEELQYFGQELFYLAQEKGPLTDQGYIDALAKNHRLSREEGIDAVLSEHGLDALVAPTGGPAWKTDLINGDHFLGASSSPAAMAGYPIVNVPAGFAYGVPVGISFMGTAFSEPTLIRLAYAFEQATQARQAPQFLPGDVEPPADAPALQTPGSAEGPNATPTTELATPTQAPTA